MVVSSVVAKITEGIARSAWRRGLWSRRRVGEAGGNDLGEVVDDTGNFIFGIRDLIDDVIGGGRGGRRWLNDDGDIVDDLLSDGSFANDGGGRGSLSEGDLGLA